MSVGRPLLHRTKAEKGAEVFSDRRPLPPLQHWRGVIDTDEWWVGKNEEVGKEKKVVGNVNTFTTPLHPKKNVSSTKGGVTDLGAR